MVRLLTWGANISNLACSDKLGSAKLFPCSQGEYSKFPEVTRWNSVVLKSSFRH